jgi:hypothetical protein
MDFKGGGPIGLSLGFDNLAERRAAAEHALVEREEWRQSQIAAQSAAGKAPEERIRVWEKLHNLDLPRARNHKLLNVIAAQTQLAVSDVVAEQERRAKPAL